jgi:hypothetical protein
MLSSLKLERGPFGLVQTMGLNYGSMMYLSLITLVAIVMPKRRTIKFILSNDPSWTANFTQNTVLSFRIDYMELTVDAEVTFYWSGPGIAERFIPPEVLFHSSCGSSACAINVTAQCIL